MSQTRAEYRVEASAQEEVERDAEQIFPETVHIRESGTSATALRRRIAIAGYALKRQRIEMQAQIELREKEIQGLEEELLAQEGVQR